MTASLRKGRDCSRNCAQIAAQEDLAPSGDSYRLGVSIDGGLAELIQGLAVLHQSQLLL